MLSVIFVIIRASMEIREGGVMGNDSATFNYSTHYLVENTNPLNIDSPDINFQNLNAMPTQEMQDLNNHVDGIVLLVEEIIKNSEKLIKKTEYDIKVLKTAADVILPLMNKLRDGTYKEHPLSEVLDKIPNKNGFDEVELPQSSDTTDEVATSKETVVTGFYLNVFNRIRGFISTYIW